jgi:hypothetical protein
MPPIETDERNQAAVLWPAAAPDAYGRAQVGDPVELDVRWEWRLSEMTDPEGSRITVDATVVVDRDVPIHSLMGLGELADWDATGTGPGDFDRMEVVARRITPDIDGREIRRTLGLRRYRSSNP